MSNLRDQAERHRLKHTRAADGEVILLGNRGHIGEWGDGRLYWCLTYDYERVTPTARYKLLAMSDPRLHLESEGDEEAVFTFSPDDLVLVARRWCRSKFRRKATASDLENLLTARRVATAMPPPSESRSA